VDGARDEGAGETECRGKVVVEDGVCAAIEVIDSLSLTSVAPTPSPPAVTKAAVASRS